MLQSLLSLTDHEIEMVTATVNDWCRANQSRLTAAKASRSDCCNRFGPEQAQREPLVGRADFAPGAVGRYRGFAMRQSMSQAERRDKFDTTNEVAARNHQSAARCSCSQNRASP